jgi:hypothetical protein
MNIASVQVVLQSKSDDDEVQRSSRISLTATEDGLSMNLFGKTVRVKDRHIFTRWFRKVSQILCANCITMNVMDTDGNQVYESCNDLSDLTYLRKTAEANDKTANDDEEDWDYDTRMVFSWYYANSIEPFVDEVETTIMFLKKSKEIAGLECPVLSEPLTVENARKFSKCSHWISKSALDGILRTQTTSEIKCPMCRQEHYSGQIESI